MTTELMEVARESRQLALTTSDVLARVTRIAEIMAKVMEEGVHYGIIPGTPKPTLFKAGAEKLLMTFAIAALPQVEDLSTDGSVRYRVRVQGVAQETGIVLGEAVGECSSDEDKYRWRKPVCDQEYDETIAEKRRTVWKKGQGGKVYQQKQVETSAADVANTILAMATKRGLVQMTRTVLACSDIFEQDLEDLPAELRESMLEHGPAKPTVQAPQRKSDQAKAAALTITGITVREGTTNGKAWKLYLITFSDGREAGTLNEEIASKAAAYRQDQTVVEAAIVPGKTAGTWRVQELTAAVAPAAAAAMTPDDLGIE